MKYAIRLLNFIFDYWYIAFIAGVTVFTLTPLVGIFLANIGSVDTYKSIFAFYGNFCHQIPERSMFINSFQFPVDYRDMALYYSFLTASFAWPLLKKKKVSWTFFLLLVFPLALDGWTQSIGLRESTNFLRIVTGVLAGGITPLFVLPYISSAFEGLKKEIEATKKSSDL